jgi:hypothetical protein
MALKVPPQHIAGIKALLELPDDKVESFLAALDAAGPQFNIEDLSSIVSSATQIPKQIVQSIIEAIASLYWTFEPAPINRLETFLDKGVYQALKRAEVFSTEGENSQWPKLKKFLLAALSHERTLGTTVKAGPVLTEHERIFDGIRVMTDLRPIYHIDVSEKPDAALVIHTMKITQRDKQRNYSDLYFAMDSNDIKVLKEALERAQKKEIALRELMKDTGVKVLDVKLTY